MTGKEWAGRREEDIPGEQCDKCDDGWLKLTYDEMVGPILRGCPHCGAGQDDGDKDER
jgi:hypothetical protein